MEYIKYIIIAVVLIIVLLAILKATKKDAGLDFNKLVEYLGGKDNIISTETNLSRFKVTLKDVSKEIANINKKIIEIAVTQRKKELEKLLEMTIEKIKELDKELQEINAELLKVKNPNSIIVDQKQKHYEYSQILKATNELKLHLEDKKRQICAYLSIL